MDLPPRPIANAPLTRRLVAAVVLIALGLTTALGTVSAAPSRSRSIPSLAVNPGTAMPGAAITVFGDRFPRQVRVQVTIDGTPVGEFETASNGRFTTTIIVPFLVPGTATVRATAGDQSASARLQVEAPPGAAPEDAPVAAVEPDGGSQATPVDDALPTLSWAPPAGWEGYQLLAIGPSGGTFRLDDASDYRISAPELISGPVTLIGGRNVVWIGGHISITNRSIVGHAQRMGLLIRDDGGELAGRTVHAEGVRFGGPDLAEGVNTDCPSAIVQLQNLRVDGVILRGADDRDGTGLYGPVGKSHPDVLQTYGGQRELRIDGLTGYSNYQGLMFKEDHLDAERGPIRLRRVNIAAIESPGDDRYSYAGNRMYFWDASRAGQQFLDPGTVWIDHHPNAGKVAASPNRRTGSGSWWHGAFREPSSSTYVPYVTRYDFDTGTQGFVGSSGDTVVRGTTTVRDGAGSLGGSEVAGPTGFTALRYNGPTGTKDWSAGGPVLSAWVYVPAGTPGHGHSARIELRDPSGGRFNGPLASLRLGEWNRIQFDTTPHTVDLASIDRLIVQVEARDVGAAWSASVDTVTQGSITTVLGTLHREPTPGELDPSAAAVFTDALERKDGDGGGVIPPVWGVDEIGSYATWPDSAVVAVNGRPGLRNADDTGPGRIYTGRHPAGDFVPAAMVGLGYRSPGWRS